MGPMDDKSDNTIEYRDPSSLEVVEERTSVPTPQPRPTKRQYMLRTLTTKRTLIASASILILLGLSIGGFIFLKKLPTQAPPTTNVTINTQSLDNGTLNQLSPEGDGNSEQQLTISPNTLFKNNATIQGSSETLKNLSVGGDARIQGSLTVQDSLTVARAVSIGTNLTVNGSISAASLNVGAITISSINISGNLAFDGHLVPGGAQPNARSSNSAGNGGSVIITGNDTSGTITIRTGGSGLAIGELAVVTFRSPFGGVPKVQLTPVGETASTLQYYVTRSANLFTINSSTAVAPNTTYTFDYFVSQ